MRKTVVLKDTRARSRVAKTVIKQSNLNYARSGQGVESCN